MDKYIPIESLYSALNFIEQNAVKGEEDNVKCITKAIRAIEFVPADVVEARHGHWIDVNGDGRLFECSVCGRISCCNAAYCNECGAKMDEVEE